MQLDVIQFSNGINISTSENTFRISMGFSPPVKGGSRFFAFYLSPTDSSDFLRMYNGSSEYYYINWDPVEGYHASS